jgi:hypothetical protein
MKENLPTIPDYKPFFTNAIKKLDDFFVFHLVFWKHYEKDANYSIFPSTVIINSLQKVAVSWI